MTEDRHLLDRYWVTAWLRGMASSLLFASSSPGRLPTHAAGSTLDQWLPRLVSAMDPRRAKRYLNLTQRSIAILSLHRRPFGLACCVAALGRKYLFVGGHGMAAIHRR